MTTMQRPLRSIQPPLGEVEAFASIYDETAARVYGVVLRVVRDPVQAEQVTQEVYLETWRQLGRSDQVRGSAVARLMTIAHGMAVDRVRSVEDAQRREVADFVRTGRFGGPVETSASPERVRRAQAVEAALAALSGEQRQAIELAYFVGLSHGEVARQLGISPCTAADRIRGGLIQLRESLLAHEAGALVGCC